MMPSPSADITALLKAWRGGDHQALERLTPLVYDHLRKLGRQYVRKERAGARGDATSLVHEAFVRLVDARTVDWQDRAHFLAVSATIMRRILVDAARARASTKRGGGMQRVDQTSADESRRPACRRNGSSRRDVRPRRCLERRWRRKIRAVRRSSSSGFSAGLSVEETAEALRRLSADRHARLEAGACVAGSGASQGLIARELQHAHRYSFTAAIPLNPMIDLLLDAGARINAKNPADKTAFDLARQYQHTRFVPTLERAGRTNK